MKRILISAGEASGELYAVGLMRALKARLPEVEFFGVGGEAMRQAGCDVVVDAKHLSVVGITEIVPQLPRIYGEFKKLIREADKRKPDAAIVIDSPAFNFKVAREMHARGVPVIYYVAPQLWAWREKRVERFHKWIKKALVIFPFEEQWYRERGVDAEFVGHPLAEVPPPNVTRDEYAAKYKLDATKQWIGLLPGSRRKEIKANYRTMLDAVDRFSPERQVLVAVVPSLIPKNHFDRNVRTYSPYGSHSGVSGPQTHLIPGAEEILRFSRAAVVASGTATVQAALAGVPFVIVYRVSKMTWLMGRRLLKVPYVGMPNLILGRKAIPELLQDEFTPENVAKELRPLLEDGPARDNMKQALAEVRVRLQAGPRDGLPAAERAAEAVLRALNWV